MTPAPERSSRAIITAIVTGSLGNLIEWYDFYIYSFGTIYFAPIFFPKSDRTSQLLLAAGVFAAGFLMRPIGGWVFGRLADTRGRRSALTLSVGLMCGGSLLIAVSPGYATIGVAAPLALLIARLAQGFSVGGEYGTSATYLCELGRPGRRGFYSSFQYVTLIGGQLLALLAIVLGQTLLTSSQMQAWGWRIPFVLGAAGAIFALRLRLTLPETSTTDSRRKAAAGAGQLWTHWRALLVVFGLTAGGSLYFYTFTTYMQKRLVNTAGLSTAAASSAMAVALTLYMLVQPAFGALADRVGARACVRWFGLLAVLGTVPILHALACVPDGAAAIGYLLAALLILSLYSATGALLKADLFPIEVRALGVGVSYAVGNALFGGSAEYVALRFKQAGHEDYFSWYVVSLCAVALLAAGLMPDSRRTGHLER